MLKEVLTTLVAVGCLASTPVAWGGEPATQPVVTDPVYLGAARLVDIGGRRLNLYCRGAGSPAVIFDSGAYDTTIAWALIQPEISNAHMTCSYDRAGLGFSDAAVRPGTAGNDVDDIHKALQAAHIEPPYVLVGHSAGGLAVRIFADRYRSEVVGMVIVDGSYEEQVSGGKARMALEVKEMPSLAGPSAAPAPNCVEAAKSGSIPKDSPLFEPCVGIMYPGVSQAITDATSAAMASLKSQKAITSEMENFGTVSADEARATRRDFGDMPIIMLTRSQSPARNGFPQAMQDRRNMDWEQYHNEVAAMSTRGVNWIVPRSKHAMNYDRPDIVIEAIHQAIAMAAEPAPAVKALQGHPIVTDAAYTRPARLVDVGGGRRINLYCRGAGAPTVVFAAGAADSTVAWGLVQPAISETHATCAFDRAGLGFSDAAVRPGTAANEADDLHMALQAAHVAPPYVLVAHSDAALSTRVFTGRFRDDVVGLVIVDGTHEDQSSRLKAIALPEAKAHWDDDIHDTTCVDALRDGEIPKTSPVYARCVGEPDPRFSQAINDARLAYGAKAKYQLAVRSETQAFRGESADEARATRSDVGDLPLIYLTHAPFKPAAGVTQLQQDQRTATVEQLHNDVAAMSTRGFNEIVPRAGHLINYDRPEIVIDAIDQVLRMASEAGGERDAGRRAPASP
ncbi:alpha/beta fold hydrolase [Luteibacter aegosomatissinici]|uniref:alpha/beta fold hydrolase n=1 Tax=Luteibacter aegosomatissinici TaxID=2911539 RepID=UPI001FFAAEC2|nr:alpha/beta hydrolase [Luteibacter aegosomatissinici]UPG96558.1 alpha/beta hydrolase [Luteibacter aegosomatissinici]